MRTLPLLLLLFSCTGKDDAPVNGDSVVTGDSPVDDSAADDSDAEDSPQDSPEDTGPFDVDGDGSPAAEDCDDEDPARHPGAEEACDDVDNDCDAAVDEGALSTFYVDADGDGHGDPDQAVEACSQPEGAVDVGDDCDDGDAALFPEADGRCASGGTCAQLLAADSSAADGVYLIDSDGAGQGQDPVSVYCDMSGGGWMLVGRQEPTTQLTKVPDDINLGEGWDADATHRWGNARLATLTPGTAWRITSHSASDASLIDDAFFSPACVIDWEAYVGTWRGERTDHYDDCGLAYSDEALTTAISAHTENNCSLGIGQNNSGNYCSMRMGSCNCFNEGCASTWADEEGVAAPCNFRDWESVVMSLWVK